MENSSFIRVVYKAVEGQEIDVDVYLPPPVEGKHYPAIIDIHGGAFMLGSSDLVSKDQIKDCLSRGWVVLVPNHRLCPQVDLLEGPMQDCRDLLEWIHSGGLEEAVSKHAATPYPVDVKRIMAFGTSSGGTLALSLGFDVPHPVSAIYTLYGPCNFAHPHWTAKLPEVAPTLPDELPEDTYRKVHSEYPVPTRGVTSLEGQSTPTGAPNLDDPRQAFAFKQIRDGTVMSTIFPSLDWQKVDPALNISGGFPPTFIVHGTEDKLVPMELSSGLYAELKKKGVKCGMNEIGGEGHTFANKMKVGSRTWELQREGFDFLESVISEE